MQKKLLDASILGEGKVIRSLILICCRTVFEYKFFFFTLFQVTLIECTRKKLETSKLKKCYFSFFLSLSKLIVPTFDENGKFMLGVFFLFRQLSAIEIIVSNNFYIPVKLLIS